MNKRPETQGHHHDIAKRRRARHYHAGSPAASQRFIDNKR
jgi:hypothetical protein